MKDILGNIVARTARQVALRKRRLPEGALEDLLHERSQAPGAFLASLRQDGTRIIAEVKRASPSRGVIHHISPASDWSPEKIALGYEKGGAAAISVLTHTEGFWGADDALALVKDAVRVPVLRKDFILDRYQLLESRWLGADAVLLMASLLDTNTGLDLVDEAERLGLDVLFEVHSEAEAEAWLPRLRDRRIAFGINQRDLSTLAIDERWAERIIPQVITQAGEGLTPVVESGIAGPEDLARYHNIGANVFLAGTHLMQTDDPGKALKAWLAAR